MFSLRTRNYKLTIHTQMQKKRYKNENIHSRGNEEEPEPRTVSETSYQVGSSGWVGGAGSRTYAGCRVMWAVECARAGAERLCESVMTGQLQGSFGTCHVNRARLASLTTFLHHDDDRRIVCMHVPGEITYMASMGWWDRDGAKTARRHSPF